MYIVLIVLGVFDHVCDTRCNFPNHYRAHYRSRDLHTQYITPGTSLRSAPKYTPCLVETHPA